MVKELNEQDFSNEIKDFKGVALVDFWAPWCGPCKMQAPIIEDLAQDFSGNEQVKIAKVNIDENNKIASDWQIMSIPTLKIFKNGQVVEELIGWQNKATLLDKINKYLN